MNELIICDGEPKEMGLYVCYVNDDLAKMPNAKRILLQWYEGKFWYPLSTQYYRDFVYGWIGPLPHQPLED